MQPRVIASPANFAKLCPEGLQLLLDRGCDVIANPHQRPFSRAELLSAAHGAAAVIAAFERWDEAAFQSAGTLQAVVRFGTGYDTVDIEAARRHNVAVANCPGANAASVAEHTVALLLSLVRDIPRLNADTHAGQWTRTVFSELAGRTLGIVGFGDIGQRVARMLSGFCMRIIACSRSPREAAARACGVTLCSFGTLIRESDFISLHLPLTPETHHIFNAETIARTKRGVYIVNTARAALIDDQAMCAALAGGHVAGLASDVFDIEPAAADHPLLQCPRFIATPHVASASRESFRTLGLMAARAIIAVLDGGEPENRLA